MPIPKYRSKYEATVAKALGDAVRYEPIKVPYIIPETKHTYTPDFTWKDFWIELKGKLDLDCRKKMVLIRKQHPTQKIVMVFQTPNAKITKGSPTTYTMWAEKAGFIVWTTAEFIELVKKS